MLQFHDFGALTSKLTDMACQFNSWKVPNFQNSTYQTFKAEDLGQQMFKIQDLENVWRIQDFACQTLKMQDFPSQKSVNFQDSVHEILIITFCQLIIEKLTTDLSNIEM